MEDLRKFSIEMHEAIANINFQMAEGLLNNEKVFMFTMDQKYNKKYAALLLEAARIEIEKIKLEIAGGLHWKD